MYDIIIIGGGPAGMTAALYAQRNGKRALVIERNGFGGQITHSPKVENYPGTLQMSGNEFADKMLDQILAQGAEIELENAVAVEDLGERKVVRTEEGSAFEGKAVVIATGVTHRPLGVAGEEDLVGAGLSYCAVCDGPFCQGRPAAVVGGGDTALQEALFLSSLCSQVTLIHRRDRFRGAEGLVRRVQEKARRQPVSPTRMHFRISRRAIFSEKTSKTKLPSACLRNRLSIKDNLSPTK